MRSLDGLSLEQTGWADHVHGFQASDVDYRGGMAGAPPVFRPPVYETPGRGLAMGTFLRILNGVREQDLGPGVDPRRPQPVSAGGYPFTATQGYLVPVPANFPVPPAWAVAVSPDEELRNNSPTRGTF